MIYDDGQELRGRQQVRRALWKTADLRMNLRRLWQQKREAEGTLVRTAASRIDVCGRGHTVGLLASKKPSHHEE